MGRLQLFKVYEDINHSSLPDGAGVFIFAGKNYQNYWLPFYIDHSHDICKTIFGDLSFWNKAKKLGATSIHILQLKNSIHHERETISNVLINTYKPILNRSEPSKNESVINNVDSTAQATVSSQVKNNQDINMSNESETTDQLNETKLKLELLYEYEKHYLGLIKDYKEEIKFANSLQEDLRRERSQFFTQTLKDVIQTMKIAEIDKAVSAQWIQELVASYTKSINLSGDLAKTHVIEILNILTAETRHHASDAKLSSINKNPVESE